MSFYEVVETHGVAVKQLNAALAERIINEEAEFVDSVLRTEGIALDSKRDRNFFRLIEARLMGYTVNMLNGDYMTIGGSTFEIVCVGGSVVLRKPLGFGNFEDVGRVYSADAVNALNYLSKQSKYHHVEFQGVLSYDGNNRDIYNSFVENRVESDNSWFMSIYEINSKKTVETQKGPAFICTQIGTSALMLVLPELVVKVSGDHRYVHIYAEQLIELLQ
ncbi:hypothetical protein [Vibrio barjaei]|uniref:hypothetical protein n=1 Tax=Vibrio barjaei TaxID=1676683 RepID=UPI002283DBCB|nr:hypothetical protein [Vibrio barjaei]MCY9870351.1 hypothetical protein [Vibrio barjaei]